MVRIGVKGTGAFRSGQSLLTEAGMDLAWVCQTPFIGHQNTGVLIARLDPPARKQSFIALVKDRLGFPCQPIESTLLGLKGLRCLDIVDRDGIACSCTQGPSARVDRGRRRWDHGSRCDHDSWHGVRCGHERWRGPPIIQDRCQSEAFVWRGVLGCGETSATGIRACRTVACCRQTLGSGDSV